MTRIQHAQSKPSLQSRILRHAAILDARADALPQGPERDNMVQRARHAETASSDVRLVDLQNGLHVKAITHVVRDGRLVPKPAGQKTHLLR